MWGRCFKKRKSIKLNLEIMQFQNGHYYHIYNRGVDRRNIFMDEKDFLRFLISMREFNSVNPIGSIYQLKQNQDFRSEDVVFGSQKTPWLLEGFRSEHQTRNLLMAKGSSQGGGEEIDEKQVEFVAYCLNHNHFHFLLKQKTDKGVEKFMQKLSNGYTQYFNRRHKRKGSLFQGSYNSARIKTDGRFLQSLLYINGNYEIHGLGKAINWPWSSCRDYLGLRKGTLCDKKIAMSYFSDQEGFITLFNEYMAEKKEWKKEEKLLEG